MRFRIIITILFFLLNLSFAEENPQKPLEIIKPPLFGIVLKGDNIIIDIDAENKFLRNNLASYIKPQTPVIISNSHKLEPYLYIETTTVKGWFHKDNIKIISPEEFDKINNLNSVLLKRSINIDSINYPIATKLPILKEGKKHYIVLLIDKEGFREYILPKKFATKSIEPSIKSLKMLTKLFKNKPYVWANDERGWDCSGLIQDMFSFVGIILPRNSFDQINFTENIDVSNLSIKEKENLLKKSKPYFTLLYFPGHIMIYTGTKGKELMSFQALSKIGEKKFGYIGTFPLKKTGLLSKVTKIGIVNKNTTYKQQTLYHHGGTNYD